MLADYPESMIVLLARQGDRGAFEELVRRRQSSVRNLLRRCCGDPTLADDLAQQVFLKVWVSLGSLERIEAFGGWLRQVALSIWLQHLRRLDALRDTVEVPAIDEQGAVRHTTGEALDLDAALSSLSPPVRSCLVLCYHEGMSHGEISQALQLPVGTVKSHIKRGAERLRRLLADYQE